ncbi:hypothetical protein Tco_0014753 [Tanacetum coccineum]
MKRSSSSTSNSQNLAFLSFENTSSTNEVSILASGMENFGVQYVGGTSLKQSDLVKMTWKNWLDIRWQCRHVDCSRVHDDLLPKDRSSDEEITPANDRFSKADGYNAVPPPITGNFLTIRADISFAGLDEYAIRKKIIKSKTDTSKSKIIKTVGKTNEVNIEKPKSVHELVMPKPKINRDKVIIEDWNSDDEDDVYAVKTVSPVKTNETQTVRNRVDKIGQISQKEGI